MFADNLDTTFYCTQTVARRMKAGKGGAIVNIASIAGLNPGTEHSHYNSAKAAVIMFTKSAAQELGPFGIRVNAVAPGLVERPGLESHSGRQRCADRDGVLRPAERCYGICLL